MRQPIKPQKKIIIEGTATFYDLNQKISLTKFMGWCKSTLPTKAKEICIEINPDKSYDDYGNVDGCYPCLILSWKQMVLNKRYDKDVKRYKKQLARWKKEQ